MVLSTSCLTVCKMWKLASPRTNNQKRERRKRLRECSRCKLLESWKLHPTVLVVCHWSQRPTLIQCGQGPHKRCTSHCRGASGPPRKEESQALSSSTLPLCSQLEFVTPSKQCESNGEGGRDPYWTLHLRSYGFPNKCYWQTCKRSHSVRFSVLSWICPSSVSQEASGNGDIRIRKPGSVYYLRNSGACSLYIDPGGHLHSQECLTLYDTPWTLARQAPLSVEFSRQEYWSGLPCPPPGDLADPGIKPVSLSSPELASGFCTTSTTWEAHIDPYPAAVLIEIWAHREW